MESYEVKDGIQYLAESDDYRKANSLINAKYRASLLENKLLAISLSKINEAVVEEVDFVDGKTKVLTSTMKNSELVKYLGANPKSLPRQLKETYSKMAGRQIGIESERGEFAFMSLVIGAFYDGGVFKIYYNPLLYDWYQKMSKNYTVLSLRKMMSFSSGLGFRLYECLRSKCYLSKDEKIPDVKKRIFEVEYGISELKLILGVINSELANVKAELGKSKTPDYDRAVKVAQDKGYEKWHDFRVAILKAIKEINEKTEMNVSFDPIRAGRGGKVHGLKFKIEIAVENEEKTIDDFTTEEKEDIEDQVRDLIEEKLKTKDIRSICEAAEYDLDKITKAYGVMRGKKNVDNVVGFLITAIKDGYEITPPKKRGNSKNQFNDFEQRDYDFEQLEMELRAN